MQAILASRPFSSAIRVTQLARNRLTQLREMHPLKVLHISVDSGGCSGFQYSFSLKERDAGERLLSLENGICVSIDDTSLGIVGGSLLDYEATVCANKFRLREIPGATLGCGCGASFDLPPEPAAAK